jgi:hypothetical protein
MELNLPEAKMLAPKGHKTLAQGFSPGLGVLKRCALKGQQVRCDERKLRALILHEPQAYSGATFRAHLFGTIHPGLEPWAKIFCPFGATCGPSPSF